ncbi:hypothetical protein C0991_010150 [Blastosporella zonata]|nr:hypothetical protein C0991_010150 [Blastosporella zonata]
MTSPASTPPNTPTASPYTVAMDPNLPPFDGDQEDENPRDFIKKLRKFVAYGNMHQASDTEKIDYFSCSLKDGGPAEMWFEDLPSGEKDTWAHLLDAFDIRWPVTQRAAKNQEDRQEELGEIRITEEELGTKEKVNGREIHAHIAWADKAQHAANAIPDSNNLLVKMTRDNCPPLLKALVPASHKTWTAFFNAVCTINIDNLRERIEREKHDKDIENKLRRLRAITAAPPTQAKALVAAFSRMQLSAPTLTPTVNNAARNTNSAATQVTVPQQNLQIQRPNAEKWAIILQLPRPTTTTDAGRTAY